jgi:hypothetical protein
MKHRTANCPGCGGPVEFNTASSLVTICDFCQSAVARGDKKVEDYGKVADIGETNSGLRIGLSGTFNKKHFHVTGRVRYQHPAGGFWDEWYLSFPGERWGWLAEAQGKFYLLFERQLNHNIHLPSFDSIVVGGVVKLGSSEFNVREKGVGTAFAADGEIPWAFRPGAEHRFVDLNGKDDTFATFEYDDKPRAFTGKEIRLADLGIDTSGGHPDAGKITVAAVQLNCPHCAGSLTLRAPDHSERITCPSCDRLLDIKDGKLKVFETLKQRSVVPVIPLGSEGTINGDNYTVIGFMERFATYEGKNYPWHEYLLYNAAQGFRWLVCNEKHWSFVEPVPTVLSGTADRIHYHGRTFRVYDRGTAFVRYVLGEFYWRVRVGETVQTADYISPPEMLSFETSFTTKSEEMNISLGTYVWPHEIERIFGIKNVPKPWGVGPISPKPDVGKGVFILWATFLATLLGIHIRYYTGYASTGSDFWLMFYGMIGVSLPPLFVLIYLYNFEVQRWRNSDFSPYVSSE